MTPSWITELEAASAMLVLLPPSLLGVHPGTPTLARSLRSKHISPGWQSSWIWQLPWQWPSKSGLAVVVSLTPIVALEAAASMHRTNAIKKKKMEQALILLLALLQLLLEDIVVGIFHLICYMSSCHVCTCIPPVFVLCYFDFLAKCHPSLTSLARSKQALPK